MQCLLQAKKKECIYFTQSCKVPFGCPFIDDDHGELAGPVGMDSQGTRLHLFLNDVSSK
jgi:hypothetical protein